MLWQQVGYSDASFVVVQENGQPYHPDRIGKLFEEAVKASGQPRIRLHDLRHYADIGIRGTPALRWPWPPGSTPRWSLKGWATLPWR